MSAVGCTPARQMEGLGDGSSAFADVHLLEPISRQCIGYVSFNDDDHAEYFNSLASKPSLPAKASAFRHRLLVQQERISLRLKGRSHATIGISKASP